jgi:hypothetical protein
MILAAIGPVCMLLGLLVFGLPYVSFSMGYLLAQAVVSYFMALLGCYILALIIDALAPSFGGTRDKVKAFKVAAYSSTAVWVAGILAIIPLLGLLILLALIYGLYLLYLGLPLLMRVPADKAAIYFVVVVVVQILLYFLAAYVASALVLSFAGPVISPASIGYTLP